MLDNMVNKSYLVTGATSGIGKAIVKELLFKGARVVGIGRDDFKVEDLKRDFPNNFIFKSINLEEVINADELVADLVQGLGKFSGMVYCAGREETFPITMYSPAKLESIFNVNFKSSFELLRVLSKKKYCVEFASFVFLASVMSELGQPGKTAYCSSKAAILGMVKAAALELAPRNIRVNAISPGVVKTPMTDKLFNLIDPENRQQIIDMHPLGTGQVEDVVPLIEFLLSDGSKWITGQNIKADGGYSIK